MPYMLDGRRLHVGRSFKTSDGATWTNQWAAVLSDEEKTAAGITWEDEPAQVDTLYWASAGNPNDLAKTKELLINQQKKHAGRALSNTDWYVTRKSEKDTAIPSNVATYRDAVRTACTAREGEINAASDMTALETLMKAPPLLENEEVNPAALTQWPEPLT
jgi:hypothetical protein